MKNLNKLPDPDLHQKISFVKSAIRIVGYCVLPVDIVLATIILVFSEMVGIVEEMI